jgi:WD40 repeat protein
VFAYLSYTPFRILHAFQMRNTISSIAWSPDSRVFAAVTCGERFGNSIAMVSVWHASDGRELYTYSYPSAPSGCSRLAWSPDGSSFAIAWADGNVNIWGAANDYSSWHEQSSFHFHVHASVNLYLTGLAWSADGNHLVMSYSDEQLHVWDIIGGHSLPPVQAPVVLRTFLSVSPDGSGAIVPAILSVSPDGTQAIVPVFLSVSPDRTQAIIPGQQTSGNDATYATWDFTTGKEVILSPSQNLLDANGVLPDFAWSPDGKALAVSDGRKVMTWHWNKQGNSWTFVRSIAVGTPNREIGALAWSPDRKRLATADSPDVIRMWSASSGELLGPFRLPWYDPPVSKNEEYYDTDNAITGLAWSPNGKYLLSGNSAGQVILRVVLWRWGLA